MAVFLAGRYKEELLDMALDLGNVLLKAFDSATGMPYPRINLKYGMEGLEQQKHTCAACAGTMLLGKIFRLMSSYECTLD